MIGDPLSEAPITWSIRVSNGAYDVSGHVPAVDDDLRFTNPGKNTKNFPKNSERKIFSFRLCWGRFRELQADLKIHQIFFKNITLAQD